MGHHAAVDAKTIVVASSNEGRASYPFFFRGGSRALLARSLGGLFLNVTRELAERSSSRQCGRLGWQDFLFVFERTGYAVRCQEKDKGAGGDTAKVLNAESGSVCAAGSVGLGNSMLAE